MMGQRMQELSRAIDDVLVAHHGLKHALNDDHPPFDGVAETGVGREQRFKAAAAVALDRYGPGPVFNLWLACRAMENLRKVWVDG